MSSSSRNRLGPFFSPSVSVIPLQRYIKSNGPASLLCFHIFRSPLLTECPAEPLPAASKAQIYQGEIWTRYPLAQSLEPTQNGVSFKAIAELRTIMNNIACCSFRHEEKVRAVPLARAREFFNELQAWYDDLPESLTPRNIVLPCHLKIQ